MGKKPKPSKSGQDLPNWSPPLKGKIAITSRLGASRFAVNSADSPRKHPGIDLRAPVGEPVHAIGDGKVIRVVDNWEPWKLGSKPDISGNRVAIQHANGVISGYMHLSEVSAKIGQYVKGGEIIGKVGTTGGKLGTQEGVEKGAEPMSPHLHLQIWEGRMAKETILNPEGFLKIIEDSPKTESLGPIDPHNDYFKTDFDAKTDLDVDTHLSGFVVTDDEPDLSLELDDDALVDLSNLDIPFDIDPSVDLPDFAIADDEPDLSLELDDGALVDLSNLGMSFDLDIGSTEFAISDDEPDLSFGMDDLDIDES